MPSSGTQARGASSGKRPTVRMKFRGSAAPRVGRPPLPFPARLAPEWRVHRHMDGLGAARPHASTESRRHRRGRKTVGRCTSEVGIQAARLLWAIISASYETINRSSPPKTRNPPESNYLHTCPLLHSMFSLHEHTERGLAFGCLCCFHKQKESW